MNNIYNFLFPMQPQKNIIPLLQSIIHPWWLWQ